MTAKTEPGIVIAFRNDRLGARLNTLLTAMRISKTYGATLKMFWFPTETDGLDQPENLFSQAFIDAHFATRADTREIMKSSIDLHSVLRRTTREEFVASIKNGTHYLSQAATQQITLPWETDEDLACIPELLMEIDLNPRVQEMIELIDERLDGLSFSSYHFRRGDIIDDNTRASHALWSTKYIPRVIYERHIQRTLSEGEGMLVIFSDTKPEADAFIALSPRVKSFDDLVGDQELTALQRDFLELYTMSRSEQIFAPPNSAFSGIAAVIGNKDVTDITADLTSEERMDAMDELVDRMENRSEIFLSQSDLGQNLPFIAQHLDKRGERKRATRITLDCIEKGVNRAYIYPFASRRLLTEANYEGCKHLLSKMSGQLSLREESVAACFQHTAQAAMINDEWEGASYHFHIGGWFSPLHRLTTENMWLLYSFGKLNLEDYFPLDPDLMIPSGRTLARLPFSEKQLLMRRLIDADKPYFNYPLHMPTRDWMRLNGKFQVSRLTEAERNRRWAEMATVDMDRNRHHKAAWHGMIGVLWRNAGEMQLARQYLQTALDMQPEKALYHKRIADLLIDEGKSEDAIPILERTVEMSGGLVPYRVELANCYRLTRDSKRYAEIMLELRKENTPLIEVRLAIADAMLRDDAASQELPDYLNELLSTTGGSHRIWQIWIKANQKLGRWDDALAGIHVISQRRATHKMLASLFRAYRSAHDETQARKWFADNGVDVDELLSSHAD